MIGVEEGKGDGEMYGNGSTVQPLHPERTSANKAHVRIKRFIFNSFLASIVSRPSSASITF